MDPKFAILLLSLLGAVSSITVVPSQYLLQAKDSIVNFNCAGFTWDAKTEVAFNINGKIAYNSSASSTAVSGVSRLNNTAISYRNVTQGADKVNCIMNRTQVSTNTWTIPFVTALTYTPVPKNISVNQQLTATCGNVRFTPNITANYYVSFLVNTTEVARWTVGNLVTFTMPQTLPSLTVARGNYLAPTFSAAMTPKSLAANGRYYCTVTYSGAQTSDQSNVWNTNSSFGLMPSISMLILAAVAALIKL